MTKIRVAVLTYLAVVLALAGCTGPTPAASPTQSSAPQSAPRSAPESAPRSALQSTPRSAPRSQTPGPSDARTRQPACSPQLEQVGRADPTGGGTFFTASPVGGVLCRYGRPATVDRTRKLVAQQLLTAAEAKSIAALTDAGAKLDVLPAGCPFSRADVVVGLFVMPTDAVVQVQYSLDSCFGLAMSAGASRLVSRNLRALLTDLTE